MVLENEEEDERYYEKIKEQIVEVPNFGEFVLELWLAVAEGLH